MEIKMMDAALRYASWGWPVLPIHYMLKDGSCSCGKPDCLSPGKHPMELLVPKGSLDASTDPLAIRLWWSRNPFWNIGLATGHGERVVLDIDEGLDKHGKPKQGPISLSKLLDAYGALPATLRARTGGGGTHYYFRSPHQIGNSQNRVGQHIDVRGVSGYVLLPPSNHASGRKYEWIDEPESGHDALAAMPQWLEAKAMGPAPLKDEEVGELDKNVAKDRSPDKLSPELTLRLLDFIPADCDRETWIRVGAALKKEIGDKKGFEAWRTWSKKWSDPKRGWTDREGERQWATIEDKGITGGTLYFLAQQNGFRGFDKEAASAPEFKEGWCWVTSIKRFIERPRMLELDSEQFDKHFQHLFLRGKPSNHVLANEEFKKFEGITYAPRAPEELEEFKEVKLNAWKPSPLVPAEGDASMFLKHIEYLYPDEAEASILLDYLAYQVQAPGEKVHWAVLMSGDQGTGKSYFARVMEYVLGQGNVNPVSNEILHETYTGWLKNCQLIVVEEMMARQRMELMNKLKPMITEPWLQIREMYKPPYRQPNRTNFLFLTNHADSIIIDNKDRRYCVLASEAAPHPAGQTYYRELFLNAERNAAAIAWCLEHRSLAHFQPKAHAPMTEGKRSLILESLNPLDHFINERVAAGEWPFAADLVIPSSVVEHLAEFSLRANPKEVGRAFARLGYARVGRSYAKDGQVNFWAVRNWRDYENMEPAQLRQVWQQQNSGAPRVTPGISDAELIKASRPVDPVKNSKPM